MSLATEERNNKAALTLGLERLHFLSFLPVHNRVFHLNGWKKGGKRGGKVLNIRQNGAEW